MREFVLLAMLALSAAAQSLSSLEQKIVSTIEASSASDIELLERLVSINSGTLNPAGVQQVGKILGEEFEKLGFRTRWVPMDEVHRAGHLLAERSGTRGKRVLLIGHMDTVFELSSPFQKFARQGNKAIGPGTADMKGGLVVMLSALKALHAAGALDGTSISIALTGDEERVGKPLSIARRDLIEAGKRSEAALCFEATARRGGRDYITVSRRGSSSWTLRVNANTGHSGQVFSESMGSGAIYELARILTSFHNDLREPSLTYSAGLVLGGTKVEFDPAGEGGSATGKSNIVPEVAMAKGDLRTITPEQLERVKEKMRAIVARHLPKTGAEISFEDSYPAMAPTPGNRALAARLNEVNRSLGLEEEPELDPLSRGAGDISFIAPFVDSISGLGLSGAGAHAAGESADLDRLPVNAKRAALLIYRLTK